MMNGKKLKTKASIRYHVFHKDNTDLDLYNKHFPTAEYGICINSVPSSTEPCAWGSLIYYTKEEVQERCDDLNKNYISWK